ncbi:MAG: septum formation initiator family protein [Deltaproteobacteria bacterium]|nr:septum formation initiator family protein [Deltaproteobacteria bacterium]
MASEKIPTMAFSFNRSKSWGVWSLLILLGFGLIFLIFNGYHEIQKMKQLAQKRETLVHLNQDLNRRNEEMYREITRLQRDPAYLEEIARKEFGLVRPDEIIFFIDEGPKKEAPRNATGIQFNHP